MVSPEDADRLFLQAVMSRGVLSSKLAQLLWKKSVEAVNRSNDALDLQPNETWDDYVSKINRSLDKLDLEFRSLHDQQTGEEIYAIVNRKADEISQLATDYCATELALFKALVEQIMLAPYESYSVSSIVALRELTASRIDLTKARAEAVLSSFVANGWLLRSKGGHYSLSTRSLIELVHYLKATYPEYISECAICQNVTTLGIGCLTSDCAVRMHIHCFKTFRKHYDACPSCRFPWPHDVGDKQFVHVGERRGVRLVGDEEGEYQQLRGGEDQDDIVIEEEEELPLPDGCIGSSGKR